MTKSELPTEQYSVQDADRAIDDANYALEAAKQPAALVRAYPERPDPGRSSALTRVKGAGQT